MSVAVIGNFMYQEPSHNAIGSLDLLLAYFRMQHYVTENFTLYAMCEARRTDSPGIFLYEELDKICRSPTSSKGYPHICRHLVT